MLVAVCDVGTLRKCHLDVDVFVLLQDDRNDEVP